LLLPFLSEFVVVDVVDELLKERMKRNLNVFHMKWEKLSIHLVVVFCWRSSIIKLLVSFDTSSIFSATLFEDELFVMLKLLMLLLLLLYFSTSRSRTGVGMMTEDDFNESS
jgi:hypothetical protein